MVFVFEHRVGLLYNKPEYVIKKNGDLLMSKYKILPMLIAAGLSLPFGAAQAAYSSDSDTGVNSLDYLENEHRTARENRLTAEQEKLLADAKALSESLRYPVDPAKAVPMAFEGDDLTYDERDGSFIANGKVKILQADAHSFQSENISGNTKTQDINIPEKGHMLQMTEGQMPLILDGYKTNYNYGSKTGAMENAKGKAGSHYITGKRFEFYADHYVVYDGTVTKCGASKPDYRWQAKKTTIYPNDKMVLEGVSFYLKGMKMFSRGHYVADISPDAKTPEYPRVGYDSDKGVYMTYPTRREIRKNVNLDSELEINKEYGWRSRHQLGWENRGLSMGVRYGYYEDSDNNWVKKEPSGYVGYSQPLGHTHINYGLSTEFGRWYGMSNHITSNHWYYGLSLSHDPIIFYKYKLRLSGGYGITRESYNDSRNSGFNYGALLTRDFDKRISAYMGYYYTYNNTKNSLFNYDTDDFSRKLEGGFSYRLDDRNRLVVGTRYDLDNKLWNDIDYYWYYDMHCAQLVTRYRSKSNQWHFSMQFTPW